MKKEAITNMKWSVDTYVTKTRLYLTWNIPGNGAPVKHSCSTLVPQRTIPTGAEASHHQTKMLGCSLHNSTPEPAIGSLLSTGALTNSFQIKPTYISGFFKNSILFKAIRH